MIFMRYELYRYVSLRDPEGPGRLLGERHDPRNGADYVDCLAIAYMNILCIYLKGL